MDAATEIGPLSRKEQKDFLLAQINDAKEQRSGCCIRWERCCQ